MRSGLVAGIPALALVALAGCGPGEGAAGRTGPPRVGDTIPLVRVTSAGDQVPWFQAPALDGDTVTVADLRGTPVLINLWATWCPPCRAETPFLQSVHERYGGALRTVGVTVDNRGAESQVRAFLEEAGVTYEILQDPSMSSTDLFGVPGLPGTFLIDPEGVVVFVRIGPVEEGDAAFEKALEELLGAPGGTGTTDDGSETPS